MANQEIGKGVWYSPDTGYIALDLTGRIPREQARTVEAIALSPKGDEYHCSLVAIRKHGIDDPDKEQGIVDAVKGYLREHDLHFTGLGDERYLCRKDERVTIVAPVMIKGIDEFVPVVGNLIPAYQRPFLHVTLLKNETTEHGISINSTEDLARYCEKLAH